MAEGDSDAGAPDDSHSLLLSIPDDIDLDSLSDLLPGTNLTSPSLEDIIALYRLLLAQALEGRSITQELDEARAEVERKDVELDQALQDRESLTRELETSLEGVHEELNQVKQERDKLGMIFSPYIHSPWSDSGRSCVSRSFTSSNRRAFRLSIFFLLRSQQPQASRGRHRT